MNLSSSSLRVHGFVPRSLVNGPGCRAVLWTQGCTLGCRGCYNPTTHSPAGGYSVPVDYAVRQIAALRPDIEGLTISGGEPLQQPNAISNLVTQIRERTDLSIILFSGFSWEEISRQPAAESVLGNIDAIVCGRFDAANKIAGDLRSSANQTIQLLSPRYSLTDLAVTYQSEVVIESRGAITISGTQPPSFATYPGH